MTDAAQAARRLFDVARLQLLTREDGAPDRSVITPGMASHLHEAGRALDDALARFAHAVASPPIGCEVPPDLPLVRARAEALRRDTALLTSADDGATCTSSNNAAARFAASRAHRPFGNHPGRRRGRPLRDGADVSDAVR